MARYQIKHGRRTLGSPATRIALLVLLLLLVIGARSLASYAIEIRWWKEVGQFNTWLSMLTYSLAPVGAATLLAFARKDSSKNGPPDRTVKSFSTQTPPTFPPT